MKDIRQRNKKTLLNIAPTLLLLALANSCGPKSLSSSNKNSPKTGAGPSAGAVEFKLSAAESLGSLKSAAEKLGSIAQVSANETHFLLTDGQAWVSGQKDGKPLFDLQNASVSAPENGQLLSVSKDAFWVLSPGKIARNNAELLNEGTTGGERKAEMATLSHGDEKSKLLGLNANNVILWIHGNQGAGHPVLFTYSDKSLSAREMEWPANVSGGDPFAAGFGEENSTLWFANKEHLLVLEKNGAQNQGAPGWSWKNYPLLLSGATGDFKALGLFLAKGPELKALGDVTLLSSTGFFSTNANAAQGASGKSFSQVVRPLADKYCISCHGDQSNVGWSGASDEFNWTGLKKQSIIARLESKTMPPEGSPQAQSMEQKDRDALLAWLKDDTLKSGAGTPNSPAPATTGFAIPQVSENNSSSDELWESKIKNIINSRCANCHAGTWTSRTLLLQNKTEVLARIALGAAAGIKMPKNGNFSGTEQADLSAWLNSAVP